LQAGTHARGNYEGDVVICSPREFWEAIETPERRVRDFPQRCVVLVAAHVSRGGSRVTRDPQGRPIRRDSIRKLGFDRRPYDEPLSPGLRRKENANPIGFTAQIVSDDWNDE
jgi:hypothetical protein